MTKPKRSSLGRGLEAILQSPDTDITSKDISGNYVVGAIANISIGKIEANPFQPRNRFEEEDLNELADSIREQGIIQPLTVRKLGYDKYQIIAGERRLRASKIAGLQEVPCYIRVANDEEMLELALIENIHRQDLNSLEIGISYQRLMEECNLTQEELSKRVGKQRSTISNYIRLLKLPAEIQVALRDNLITMSHARTFITLENKEEQLQLLAEILENELSVRDIEQRVKQKRKIKVKKRPAPLPDKYQSLGKKLENILGAKVQMKKSNKGKGSIVIGFDSEEELDRIINLLVD
ncbi:MAG TPA: ParB/RepB/Spo0J family partition protein [Bacteroidales bacterium]|nr:ParB/RepB/Spo0J family partition protein [Bacteroidales bacterium]HPR57027.1 ParB/RepB/Spo0J family partition protein [Bacteroidales bacterium]HRW97264.1 ParB/RepB/Spo0J family partition protein [Bacteroidales bacterium]